jgi:hypothetical protein
MDQKYYALFAEKTLLKNLELLFAQIVETRLVQNNFFFQKTKNMTPQEAKERLFSLLSNRGIYSLYIKGKTDDNFNSLFLPLDFSVQDTWRIKRNFVFKDIFLAHDTNGNKSGWVVLGDWEVQNTQ